MVASVAFFDMSATTNVICLAHVHRACETWGSNGNVTDTLAIGAAWAPSPEAGKSLSSRGSSRLGVTDRCVTDSLAIGAAWASSPDAGRSLASPISSRLGVTDRCVTDTLAIGEGWASSVARDVFHLRTRPMAGLAASCDP